MSFDQTLNELRYGGPEVRMRAASNLALSNNPQVTPYLIEALRDEDPEVRVAAARALNTYRDPQAVPELLRLLRDNNFAVTEAAATTLGLIGDPAAVKPLLDLIERAHRYGPVTQPQHQTIVQGIVALGRIKDVRATSMMVKTLKKGYKDSLSDWHVQVRQAAALSLGLLDQPPGTTALIETLRDDERTEVRESAVTALSMLRSENSLRQLLGNLNFAPFENPSKLWPRQHGIIIALGERGDRIAVPHLLPLVNSTFPEIRIALSEALVKLGETERGEVLINLLRDRSANVRHAAAQALGQLGIQSAAGPLSAVLVDPDKRVAGAAQNALENIKGLLGSGAAARALPSGPNPPPPASPENGG